MADNANADVRIRYLEQVTQQLGDQVKVMKQLVTTEVADLKGVMQQQVAEIKQIVMHQDRVYQERIRRLEARVEQLSEFSMQLARTSGGTGGAIQLPSSDSLAPADSSPKEAIKFDDDDDDGLEGQEKIMNKYSEKINSVYDYYTQSNIQVFHPTMTLPHFTKMCRDCNLAGFSQSQPVELLWMGIMRKLGKRRHHRELHRNSTLMAGKYTNAKNKPKENFAYERLDDIPREFFGDALSILAMERIGAQRADLPPEHQFETFLVCDIFPNVDRAMTVSQSQPAALAREMVGASSIQDYKCDEVHGIMKGYISRLNESFKSSIKSAQRFTDEAMNLDGFVEFVRKHDILPMISKPDIRQIFLACSTIEKQNNKEAKPDTISMKAFTLCIYHLADRIYGDRLYSDKYPTPASRIQKLLAKMYLLR